MEYPGSHLTKPWRNALLITAFVSFFVIFPIVVMTAAGYRYDWKNGLLRETGSISIDIKPTNAVIYLNDIEIKEKIPVRLNNITPRKYIVRVTAAGYYDWQKEIEVKNKQTVYIKEISLLKNNEPTKIINRGGDGLTLSADGRYLAYYSENGVWIYDHNTQTEKKVASWNEKTAPSLKWSLKKYYLAIGKQTESETITIIDAEKQTPWYVTDAQKLPINKFQWQESAETELIFSTAKKIFVARPTTQKIIEEADNKYQDWFSENGSLWTLQVSSTPEIKIIKDTLGFATNFSAVDYMSLGAKTSTTSDWTISLAQNNTVLLKKKNTSEMFIAYSGGFTGITGEKSFVSPYNSWWLIWTPWELNSYSSGSEPVLLNRSGEELRQVWPLDEYNTLLLVWKDKATILFPYYDVGHILINKTTDSSVADSKNKILFFSTKIAEKNSIWELKY